MLNLIKGVDAWDDGIASLEVLMYNIIPIQRAQSVGIDLAAEKLGVSKHTILHYLTQHGFTFEKQHGIRLKYEHLEIVANEYVKAVKRQRKKYIAEFYRRQNAPVIAWTRDAWYSEYEGDIILHKLPLNELQEFAFDFQGQEVLDELNYERLKQDFIDELLWAEYRVNHKIHLPKSFLKFLCKIQIPINNIGAFIHRRIPFRLFHVFPDDEDHTKDAKLTFSSPSQHWIQQRGACLLNNLKTSHLHERYNLTNRTHSEMQPCAA